MKQAILDSTSSKHNNQELASQQRSLSVSFTQIVNNVVHTILFTLLLYVLNRGSNGSVVHLFKSHFYCEAKV